MNLYVRTKFFKPNLVSSLCRFATTSTEVTEQSEQVIVDDTEEAQAREEEIQKKRNISRLNPQYFNLVNGRRPFEEPKSIAHLTVKYNRKLYGTYGKASGVNPSICWPTQKDIEETIEYESVAYPYTIKQIMDATKEKRREEQMKITQREQDLATKYAKLEKWKQELNDKIKKKEAEAKAAKEKKDRLVEEVRRHFGFTLDPRDERFKEMLAKREKEQKKLEKKARQEAKEKLMIAKLQQKNAELS